jgi:hypothetical protein
MKNVPNLQQIPLHTEDGLRIREAFVAPSNSGIDYAQVELRIIAPMGDDAEVVSFDRGQTFRAVVAGALQRPEFNCRGAALIFAKMVASGKRKQEDVHGY